MIARHIDRRWMLKGVVSAAAGIASPALLKTTYAQASAFRIGVPTAITGNWALQAVQIQRTCRLYAKYINSRGGIDGRQVNFSFEDTQGDPATCVRKAREMVERQGINILTGVIASSEALALLPNLENWNAIYISSVNGAGSITADHFVRNGFRSNTSAPMGARAIALWLEDSPKKKVFSIGQDYAMGRSSVSTFEKLVADMGKVNLGSLFSPLGTKDYSSYIARIRDANPEILYIGMSGDDATAFLKQAGQYRLAERVEMVISSLDIDDIKPIGNAAVGLLGITRYSFTYDSPKNSEFVRLFQTEYADVPDTYDGEQWQVFELLHAAVSKAKSTDTAALIGALEGLEIESIKGPIKMRACDHQADQQVFVARVGRHGGASYPVPEIIKAYPAENVTPGCRKEKF
jgi:branched-chain amino acid transport system substrate-binding protein